MHITCLRTVKQNYDKDVKIDNLKKKNRDHKKVSKQDEDTGN